MHVTYNATSKNFTISRIDEDDLIDIHNRVTDEVMKEKIRKALYGSMTPKQIYKLQGVTVAMYWQRRGLKTN